VLLEKHFVLGSARRAGVHWAWTGTQAKIKVPKHDKAKHIRNTEVRQQPRSIDSVVL